jgi:hypothetical protein
MNNWIVPRVGLAVYAMKNSISCKNVWRALKMGDKAANNNRTMTRGGGDERWRWLNEQYTVSVQKKCSLFNCLMLFYTSRKVFCFNTWNRNFTVLWKTVKTNSIFQQQSICRCFESVKAFCWGMNFWLAISTFNFVPAARKITSSFVHNILQPRLTTRKVFVSS